MGMNKKSIKKMLNTSMPAIGSWITLAHPAIAEIMANAGFDWLAVDLEHSVITIREAEELIRVIELVGVSPMVRLTSNNPDQIKRLMDAGAHGIIVPMVNSSEDAKRAVNAVRYPLDGERGIGLARAQGYGAHFKEYLEWQRDQSVVIVQIEHIDAVNKLESIFSVSGVDGFIVGPYDLSASMGIPGSFRDPDFLEVMERIRKVSLEMEIPGGVHIVEPDPEKLKQHICDGYQFIAYSVDIRMLDVSCRKAIECIGKTKT